MTTFLTIAQVAEATGLSTHTLRYYERIGLLDSVQRRDNGHRVFRAEDMTWLEFLLRLRDTGMPIAQMQAYAALRRQGDSLESVSARQRLLELHAAALEAELRARAETLAVLRVKLVVYDGIRARIEAAEGTGGAEGAERAKGSASSSPKSKHTPKRQPNEDAHDPDRPRRTSRKPRQPAGRPLRAGLAKAQGSR
ncbi:MerR family transcriptional regulator [Ralstonia flatus]|uniref:MerR family transcriptional regulator n=1 Tax=Ralstonia flatus TaxID=3058601 RepID=UPI002931C2D8|nr:MerR family transcriptional regulator [Ralstonia sp. LMG 32965]